MIYPKFCVILMSSILVVFLCYINFILISWTFEYSIILESPINTDLTEISIDGY